MMKKTDLMGLLPQVELWLLKKHQAVNKNLYNNDNSLLNI